MNRGFAMTYLHLGKNDLALRYLKQAEALLKEYNIANRQLEIKRSMPCIIGTSGNWISR